MKENGQNPDFTPSSLAEARILVAEEYGLPVNHRAVADIVELKRREELALDALKDVLDHHDETDAILEKFKVDEMTGLPRRDAFFEEIDIARETVHFNTANGIKGHNTAMLAMVDLKKLHKINKKGGHPLGDKTIGATGRFLGNFIQPGDDMNATAGRLGGDEFGLLTTFDDSIVTIQMAEEVIRRRIMDWAADNTPYGIRLGDIAVSTPDKTNTELLREADPKAPKSRYQRIGKFTLNVIYAAGRQFQKIN